MKQIPKNLLDACIAATRAFWRDFESSSDSKKKELLSAKMQTAYQLDEAIGLPWVKVQNFLDGILPNDGFAPDAENETIYSALRVLGWEVVE